MHGPIIPQPRVSPHSSGQRWGKTFLNKSGLRQPHQLQRCILGLCAISLLLVTFLGHSTVLARPNQRPTYQESPLSPVATPITATITVTITATDSLPVTTTAPLLEPTAALPVPTVALVNQGQTSLLLVGAVLVGILVVIGLVIWRQR